MRALVVDNESVMRSVLSRLLSRAGWVVEVAADGDEALEVFSTERFDVAIVDVDLGEGPDGILVAQRFKNLEPQVRIILMSGNSLNEERVRDAKLGNFLLKPFEIQSLLNRVASHQA